MNTQRTMNTQNTPKIEGESFCTKGAEAIWRHAVAILLLVHFWMPTTASAQIDFQPLEQAMTKEERSRSGVDSLSAEQRSFLNNWLQQHYGTETTNLQAETDSSANKTVQTNDEQVIEAEVERRVADELALKAASAKKAVRSQTYSATIIGDFSGWQGKTLFRLDNGEIWRQKGASKYRYQGSDRTVSLKQNWAGGWEMEVIATGKRVLVKKIR